ncbi:MAG: hypothetical protein HY550_05130 [Elusimicrobia bacterium]|nr:hypothetical protein [Elusimicrobiota bacterium]
MVEIEAAPWLQVPALYRAESFKKRNWFYPFLSRALKDLAIWMMRLRSFGELPRRILMRESRSFSRPAEKYTAVFSRVAEGAAVKAPRAPESSSGSGFFRGMSQI